ncbi:Thioredoxin [Dethiosulfatibacter aminovorans DSM 17477]|uniref:Thioredoxin n=1 Tax=Dethiosulfatibacter aminovorans DSM 17477 TaxID=1121476 RepID=A0A1M6JDT1_9FIRM|nr:protein disulfide isomerase family protein [Dethiosulfatibacter aminovorans]SHJ44835.1 Thioredoxin [Dethiosulfatibacter aminovorans DSM 17477]
MKKTYLILVLILAMVLAACSPQETTEEPAESEEPAEDIQEEPGETGDEVVEQSEADTEESSEEPEEAAEEPAEEENDYSGELKEAYEYGKVLYDLGLFNGVSTEKYEPNLEGDMNREQAMKMIVSALGWEPSSEEQCPFSDVSDWAKPYVGRAYLKGIALGTVPENNIFGAKDSVTMQQLLTFYLRALGYETSYAYENALKLGEITGLTDNIEPTEDNLKRYHLVIATYNALGASRLESARTLAEDLISEGLIESSMAEEFGLIQNYKYQSQREYGPVELDAENFADMITGEEKALVLFFQNGNELCEEMELPFYNTAVALADVARVGVLNEKEAGDLLTEYNITSFPSLKLFKAGEDTTLPAVPDMDTLVQWVKNN